MGRIRYNPTLRQQRAEARNTRIEFDIRHALRGIQGRHLTSDDLVDALLPVVRRHYWYGYKAGVICAQEGCVAVQEGESEPIPLPERSDVHGQTS